MMSEEDEVALVVESDDAAAVKFWLPGEESSQETFDAVSQSRVEVVQDQFRQVLRRVPVVPNLFVEDNAGDLESGCRTIRQMANY